MLLDKVIPKIIEFRDRRGWKKFHKPKDLALSISLEAAELLELFQWKNEGEVEAFISKYKERVAEEAADIFIYLLTLCYDLQIDPVKAIEDKLKKNEVKYPVEKARDTYKKYTEL